MLSKLLYGISRIKDVLEPPWVTLRLSHKPVLYLG